MTELLQSFFKRKLSFEVRKRIYNYYFHTRYLYTEKKYEGTIYPQRHKKYWLDPFPSMPSNKIDNFFARLIQ